MSDRPELEFTGERVVPGLVDPDLLNEHLARYRFAARYAEGASVLDAGCGSGYGARELARAAKVEGIDVSAEAIDHATRNFAGPRVHFQRAACERLPFADASFDLVLAFEVIEHLERWQDLLTEARRVLRPEGILLVSTPNKAYYAEARGAAGPNPYHVREFEYAEFAAALKAVFPHVHLWTQNHAEAIAFSPSSPSRGDFDAPGDTAPEHAHFFLAVCSRSPLPASRAFAWSPASGNLLRDRERHIALLESELAKKDAWLQQTLAGHSSLQASHEELLRELQRSNAWSARLNAELAKAGKAIAGLQAELETTHAGYRERVRSLEAELEATHAGYEEKVRQLEGEAAARLEWVRDLEEQIRRGSDQIATLDRELLGRTQWAQSLQSQLHAAGSSKWVRLGRRLHLGPEIASGGKPGGTRE